MNRTVFQITDDNFCECIEVSKEIFWMYDNIIYNGGIIHNIDY